MNYINKEVYTVFLTVPLEDSNQENIERLAEFLIAKFVNPESEAVVMATKHNSEGEFLDLICHLSYHKPEDESYLTEAEVENLDETLKKSREESEFESKLIKPQNPETVYYHPKYKGAK